MADGITLRRFADFYCRPVPKHDAFQRGFVRLTAPTISSVNEVLVQVAVALGLEEGNKLRIDTTVAQTNIHDPTDNTLLWDVVRVVTRLVGRLAEASGRPIKGVRNRTRAARRRMLEIQRMTTTQRHEQQTGKYRECLGRSFRHLRPMQTARRGRRKAPLEAGVFATPFRRRSAEAERDSRRQDQA